MGIFGEKTGERKRAKQIAESARELRKALLAGGADKKLADAQLKDLREALEFGGTLRQGYVDSQEHLALARRMLISLLENMGESPVEDVKRSLDELNGHLAKICHVCGIREDDPDFKSTAEGLKNMALDLGGANKIMLRSELENLQALLEDTSGWRSPNFFALAYFMRHGDESRVGEMENESRNGFLLAYLNENLMDALGAEAQAAGCADKLETMIRESVFG